MLRILGVGGAVLLVLACSGAAKTPTPQSFDWGDAAVDLDAGAPHGMTGGSPGGVKGQTPPPFDWQDASAVDCPPSAKLVYVMGSDASLYAFDPSALKFTEVGKIACTSAPSHMTIDRHGIAWVVSDGKLYRVSTTDAACAEVTTWKPDSTRFPDFALTFLATSAAAADPLYILGQGSETLATFDPTSGVVTNLGVAKLTATLGDMTSDGTGRLYLLVDADPRALDQLDPTSAAVLAAYTINQAPVADQALAYFDGAFYVFEDTILFRYDLATQKAETLGTAPISVTGAGQSTCVR